MAVDTGIGSLQQLQDDQEQRNAARQAAELRNKLYAQLSGIPGRGRDDNMRFCHSLDGMSLAQRRQAIQERFGATCLDRVAPLLQQLECIGI